MVRYNADSLVGPPGCRHRLYSASRIEKPHYTITTMPDPTSKLAVRGFPLGVVGELSATAEFGAVPPEWLRMGGWLTAWQPPPEELWRTSWRSQLGG